MRAEGRPVESRASALWGRGSKNHRRLAALARTLAVLATLVLALAVGVATAAAAPPPPGTHGNSAGKTPSNPLQWVSTGTYAPGSFLARAQANQALSYKVIIEAKRLLALNDLKQWVGPYGRLKRSYQLLNGISVTLPGWAILYVVEHPQTFQGVTITEDVPVALSAQTGPDDWQATIGADQFWAQPGTTCATHGQNGSQIDPTCTPTPAYNAPQAPAIAIVDSGIDATKTADFGTRIVARVNFASDNATGDPLGHGTMVAGVAAGAANSVSGGGVAQNAPLVDLRVADKQGQADTSDVIAALDWVLQNRSTYNIRVVNLSLSGNQQTSFQFDPLDQAVERLWLNGIVVVAAAGNNGTDQPTLDLGAPGNDPFIITAGADDTNGTVAPGDDFKAPWSAFGYTPDGFMKPDVSAPGRFMVAPIPSGSTLLNAVPDRLVAPGYLWMSGTSFSSPAVAGAAAQLLALHPAWTPDDVKGALMAGAVHLAQAGTGIGEINLPAANAVTSPPNPNEGLEGFVTTAPDTGLRMFDWSAWSNAVSTSSNWVVSNWVASNWVASNWVASNWVASNWVASNWVASNWVASNWVQ